MTELDEKRLNELETIVWDFPSLINTRFERFDAETDANRVALADNTARLVQVERRLNALTTDMRDMRAGITRHMLEQSRQMTAVVAKVDALATRMDGLEDRIGKLEGRLEGLEGRLEGLEGRIDRLEGNIVGRMDMLETGQKAILDSLQQLLSRPR
jgi:predicted  nucleic acid-binding Zn-ribbon protein